MCSVETPPQPRAGEEPAPFVPFDWDAVGRATPFAPLLAIEAPNLDDDDVEMLPTTPPGAEAWEFGKSTKHLRYEGLDKRGLDDPLDKLQDDEHDVVIDVDAERRLPRTLASASAPPATDMGHVVLLDG